MEVYKQLIAKNKLEEAAKLLPDSYDQKCLILARIYRLKNNRFASPLEIGSETELIGRSIIDAFNKVEEKLIPRTKSEVLKELYYKYCFIERAEKFRNQIEVTFLALIRHEGLLSLDNSYDAFGECEAHINSMIREVFENEKKYQDYV